MTYGLNDLLAGQSGTGSPNRINNFSALKILKPLLYEVSSLAFAKDFYWVVINPFFINQFCTNFTVPCLV